MYGNHETIGAALKEWQGKREDLWITEFAYEHDSSLWLIIVITAKSFPA